MMLRSFHRLFLVALLTSCVGAVAAPPAPEVKELLERNVVDMVRMFDETMAAPSPQPSLRDLTQYSHYVMSMRLDPAKAEKTLRYMMSLQNMDPASPEYGDVPWRVGRPDMKDSNGIEFTMMPVGALLVGYRDKLSPGLVHDLEPHVHAALAAIRRHQVPVRYTNIYLMKTANLLLLGEAVNDPTALADAEAALDTWIAETRTTGIGEYSSVTYSAVQLSCASFAYTYTHQPAMKAKLARVLNLLYADAMANYFPGNQKMVGPQSRCYNFSASRGPMEAFYYMVGLRSAPPLTGMFSEGGRFIAVADDGNLLPGDDLLQLARIPERIYKTKWSNEPGKDRYLYMTSDYAIGSSSAWYAPQDRQIAVDVAGGPNFPPVQVMSDAQDAPYGTTLVKGKDGHTKPMHMRNLSSTVQEKGVILALWDLAPDAGKVPTSSIATNILFPLAADQIVLNGQPIQLVRDGANQIIKPAAGAGYADPVLGLRYGKAGIAIRFFRVDSAGGNGPAFELKNDGSELGVGRLAAYHYRGEERAVKESAMRVGMLIVAETCATAESFQRLLDTISTATITQDVTGPLWSAKASIHDVTLESALDSHAKVTVSRKVNGTPYVSQPMSLNGVDLMNGILSGTSVSSKGLLQN